MLLALLGLAASTQATAAQPANTFEPKAGKKLTEWGVARRDNITFVRQLFHWTNKLPRMRMLFYYRGFGGLVDR